MDPSVGPFKGGLQDFPAGLGLETQLPMQGAGVSPGREPDRTHHSEDR